MIRIAVIGAGRWGKNLIRNFSDLGTLAAICSEDLENAYPIAASFQVPLLNYETILTDPSIDAIVIATDARSHFNLAQQALQHGKHVYVEKPITLNFSQAHELATLADQYHRILMTGHLLQYHIAFLELQKRIQTGSIGQIRKLHARRLFMGRIRQTENVVWDLLPHDLSMILGLVQEQIESVKVTANASFGSCADTVQASITFSHGITAYLDASWSFPLKEQSLTIIGERGVLIFDDTKPWEHKLQHIDLAIHRTQDDILTECKNAQNISLATDEPLKKECQHFIECVQSGQPSRTGPAEFLPVMRLCQQINDLMGDLE